MKRAALILIICFFGCSINSGAAQEPTIERGQTMLKHGAYREAIATFIALLQKNPADAEARRGLVAALFETGDYTEAEKKAKDFLKDQPSDLLLQVMLAEVQLETGRYAEAASAFDRARREAKGAVFLRASLGRARALLAQAKEEEAQPVLQEFIAYYNQNGPTSAEELTLIAQALVHLQKYRDANDLYIDAREADPSYIAAYIGQGELLNEKYNYQDAASLFQDAFKINENSPRAQVGLAESRRLTSSSAALASVERALKVNPNYVDALALHAWLDIEADQAESAARTIEHGLKVNPNSIKLLALRAAISYLADKKGDLEADTRKALAINPKAGEFFATLAHFAVINRRYADSVEFGRRAIELSPRLWQARTELGIQLMRVGKVAEGRAELERAFEGDPFNVWAKNTLDLLDSIQNYRDTVSGPFLIKTAPDEADVVAPYAASLLGDAHKKLTAKYRFTPRAPITIELYPNHEDFAVRSLGLPGLGALGICFGQVVAMDSPRARPAGEFNWGSTLWHEYAHVITLQITDHRIPRWFSEGLSVFEERRARPGWGDNWNIPRLKAYLDGRFVKIDDLDSAFLRPKSPDQIPLAYFQASLVCDFIEEKHGFDAILKMLALYKEGVKTPDVFKRALALAPGDFDKAFDEWLKAKTSGYVEALNLAASSPAQTGTPSKESLLAVLQQRPNDYFANLRLGSIYKTEGDLDRAVEHLKRAATAFPFYGGEGNPYVQLADIYESRGQKAEAAQALEALTRSSDTNIEAFKRLARLRLDMGDRAGALDALITSFYVHPFEASLHKLAGDVYLEQSNTAEAAREYRVVVALRPPDMAEAHYDLARTLDAMGNRAEARREVLRALEIAPGFEKAQELLLKLRGGK
ncbi:MAG TPA: tetratricopeptide repeat protein [Blastocatellia bacterium]|nr:tetratricopeptide repeat protein [Blastocatellia bacterium]